MNSRIFLYTAVGWACLQTLVAASTERAFTARAEPYLDGLVANHEFSGAVLVGCGGEVWLKKGYGLANREHDIPNTPQTKFRLGSVTKQFTAMCVLKLQEEKKLSLDDPVGKFLPDSPTAWEPITIRHLLNHTSGIPGFTEFPDNLQHERLPTTVEKTVSRFKDKPLDFEPGEKFKYSNSGYVLLGYIIERVMGQRYESVVRGKIFEPLEMDDSGYDHPSTVLKQRASGYVRRNGEWMNCIHFEMDTPHAAGALYSTVEDLFRWDRALDAKRLVSAESFGAMFTPGKGNYGYGWFVRTESGRSTIEHGGGIAGFVTYLARYPEAKAVIIVLSNLENARPGKIGNELASMLFAE